MSLKSAVVKDYLTQFPDVPSRTISNMIYNDAVLSGIGRGYPPKICQR
jgi:hypothetical protein